MALIKWQPEFCTGIDSVDHEHRLLIEQVNAVYAMIDDKVDKEVVIDRLGDIYGSISAHFALEEGMMLRHSYDQYSEHKADHDRLLDDIRDITDEYENTISLNDVVFKQKLNDWFQLHFKTFDSRLHKLANLRTHDHVDETVMKSLIQRAKETFLGAGR